LVRTPTHFVIGPQFFVALKRETLMASRQRVLPVTVGENTVVYAYVTAIASEEEVASRILSFDGVISAIEEISKRLSTAFAAVKPDKASVEFNVEIAAESGRLTALLFGGKGSAAIKIALEWAGKPNA